MEEVSSKSTLKQCKLPKNGTGVVKYLRSVQGQKVVRLLFRLKTGSAVVFFGHEECKMIIDERCVMC